MKYIRVYAEIDLNAIRHNFETVKKRTGGKVLAVIKANAYGHGAVRVANEIKDLADYFAVATIEEAVELRENSIDTPILILGYLSPEYFPELVKYNITQTIFDYESACLLAKAGGKAHIAVDTGMSRIGFPVNRESVETIKKINSLEGITIEGIFTHFASADEKDKNFTNLQYERFMSFCKTLEDEGVTIPIKHVSNSAAIIDEPDYYLDMVRAGIIMYGLMPSDEVGEMDLIPAMKLKSHVVNVKVLPKGVPISYGRTFVTERESTIATIPVGYADGYPRALSNKGRVMINGKSAPIVGRVCMDQFMVDVTDIGKVKIGDEVCLIDENITADEIARLDGTINYEIVCGISERVHRIYKQRDE
jgi:alanine racemase